MGDEVSHDGGGHAYLHAYTSAHAQAAAQIQVSHCRPTHPHTHIHTHPYLQHVRACMHVGVFACSTNARAHTGVDARALPLPPPTCHARRPDPPHRHLPTPAAHHLPHRPRRPLPCPRRKFGGNNNSKAGPKPTTPDKFGAASRVCGPGGGGGGGGGGGQDWASEWGADGAVDLLRAARAGLGVCLCRRICICTCMHVYIYRTYMRICI